jgi:hypothetical protein
VGGGWATASESDVNKKGFDESDLGVGNLSLGSSSLSSSTPLPQQSAWSRGSATIIQAAKPPPAPTPAPKPVEVSQVEMQMPSTVDVNSLLDGTMPNQLIFSFLFFFSFFFFSLLLSNFDVWRHSLISFFFLCSSHS